MGLDIKYQAMPEDGELLREARRNRNLAESLPFFAASIKRGRLPNDHPGAKSANPFWELAVKTLERHSGLDDRKLFWGRSWDMVYYLLSERRRNPKNGFPKHKEREILEKGLFGGEEVLPDTGVMFLSRAEVLEVTGYFSTITPASFHPNVDVDAMIAAGVYKASQLLHDNERIFALLRHKFEELKQFYQLVAEHGEGVIVYMF